MKKKNLLLVIIVLVTLIGQMPSIAQSEDLRLPKSKVDKA